MSRSSCHFCHLLNLLLGPISSEFTSLAASVASFSSVSIATVVPNEVTARTFPSASKISSALFITSSNPSCTPAVIVLASVTNVDVDAFNSVINAVKSEPSYESSNNIFKSLLIPSTSLEISVILVIASSKEAAVTFKSVALPFADSTNLSAPARAVSVITIAAPKCPVTIAFSAV